MEVELRKILLTIDELDNKVYMIKAPEKTASPYCVYTLNRNDEEYNLNGVEGNQYQIYDINIYSKKLVILKTITKKIKNKLLSLLGETQGAYFIQSVKVNMSDFYDSSVDMNRSVIELEIYYKEV